MFDNKIQNTVADTQNSHGKGGYQLTSIFLFACYSSVAMVFHYVLISTPVCHYVHHYMYLKSSVYNSHCLVLNVFCYTLLLCCAAILYDWISLHGSLILFLYHPRPIPDTMCQICTVVLNILQGMKVLP